MPRCRLFFSECSTAASPPQTQKQCPRLSGCRGLLLSALQTWSVMLRGAVWHDPVRAALSRPVTDPAHRIDLPPGPEVHSTPFSRPRVRVDSAHTRGFLGK